MSDGFDELVVRITRTGAHARVTVSGDVDLASVATLRAVLDGERHGTTGDVEVDTSGISFCDSVGLGALLAARRDLAAAGRTLRLVNPSPCVIRLLLLTATSEVFEVATRATPAGCLDTTTRDDGP